MSGNAIQIVYVGFSVELLEILMKDTRFHLQAVVTTGGRIHKDIRCKLAEKGIKVFDVIGKEDVKAAFQMLRSCVVIMHKFSIIIAEDVVNRFFFFNIHCGDLRSNRGAHSLRWSILLQDQETKLTLYQIDGIDEGLVIEEESISICGEDDVVALEKKMNDKLPKMVDALYGYVSKKTDRQYEMIKNGIYRRKIQEEDYRIELGTDNYFDIRRKINAVSDFGGAVVFLDGVKRRVFDAEVLNDREKAKREEKQGDYVYLSPKGEWIELHYKDFVLL